MLAGLGDPDIGNAHTAKRDQSRYVYDCVAANLGVADCDFPGFTSIGISKHVAIILQFFPAR